MHSVLYQSMKLWNLISVIQMVIDARIQVMWIGAGIQWKKGVLVSPNALSLQVHDIVESNFQDSDGVVLKIQVMRRVASLTRQNSFFVDKYLICQWFCTFNC